MTRAARGVLVIAGALCLGTGCAYQNAIYNSARVYEEAERLRRAGEREAASERYREVVRRTGEAFRARPNSAWAGEALFLLGRAQLRLGDAPAAREALAQAEARVDPARASAVAVYAASSLAASGDRARALEKVSRALEGSLDDDARAQAHLLRGLLQLERGDVDSAWWDLDRASEAGAEVRVEAALARLGAAVEAGEPERGRRAMDLLLSYPEAGVRLDAALASLARAEELWGPAAAAGLLGGSDAARWERSARGRILLERARLLRAAGEVGLAEDLAWSVAEGRGDVSALGRVVLAEWHLDRARDLAEVDEVRRILLPAATHPEVSELLGAIEALDRYAALGLDEPLGWFAAAEVARDRLGARYVARGLFLAYADGSAGDPWAAKALLAALEVSASETDRAWLRDRLETYAASPYVLAARGGPAAGFEALEEELAVRLRDISTR